MNDDKIKSEVLAWLRGCYPLKRDDIEIMKAIDLTIAKCREYFEKEKLEIENELVKGLEEMIDFFSSVEAKKEVMETVRPFIEKAIKQSRRQERQKIYEDMKKFLENYRSWEQYFDEMGTPEGKKVFQATLENVRKDLLKDLESDD